MAVCVAKATSVMSYEDLCAAFLHFRTVPGAGGVDHMHHWLQEHNDDVAGKAAQTVAGVSHNVVVRFLIRSTNWSPPLCRHRAQYLATVPHFS